MSPIPTLKRSIETVDDDNDEQYERTLRPLSTHFPLSRVRSTLPALEPRFNPNGPLSFDKASRMRLLDGDDREADSDGDSFLNGNPGHQGRSKSPMRFLHNVCYGMIYNTKLKIINAAFDFNDDLQHPPKRFLHEKMYGISLISEVNGFFLKSKSTENVAALNERAGNALQQILKIPSTKYRTYIAVEEWDQLCSAQPKTEKSTYISANIILYGPKETGDNIGNLLSKERLYLQHPCWEEPDQEYINPHVLQLSIRQYTPPSSQTQTSGTVTPLTESRTIMDIMGLEQIEGSNSQIQRRVNTVLNSLTRDKHLKRLKADIRIRTQLLPHQEEALDFMSQRETGPIPEDYSLWVKKRRNHENFYENRITGLVTSTEPIETGGGILADDMGLGKTLTMIAFIIRTAPEASAYCQPEEKVGICQPESKTKQNILSKSTLVVCPNPLLLEGWLQEVERHCDGSLDISVYHGRNRRRDSEALSKTDVVWFRIVLDEAHIIRRISTKLFQAMFKISARFRWCLTGTPIQNSLEDLASLAAFIKTYPLDNLPDFRKHIISPLINNTGQGCDALRQFLDSVCLRRTKTLLHLQEDKHECRQIKFTAEEQIQYETTKQAMIKMANQNIGMVKNMKGYFGVFQLQLQLRRLCNHGTFQRAFTHMSMEDKKCDQEEAFQVFQANKDTTCTYCPVEVTGLRGCGEEHSGRITICGHLLCSEQCISRYKKSLQKNDDREDFKCSLCGQDVPERCLLAGDETKSAKSVTVEDQQYFREDGYSSKVAALVSDIENNETAKKSIVFSCWTKSLDLVGKLLQKKKIHYLRIDGSYSLSQRHQVLRDFEHNPILRILIMTAGTGATGLNLTIANIVYILEPQWNPMVEDQAIARVLRLGQDSEVKIVRYVMEGTVEKGMQEQQTVKLEFARVGWREDS